jgi:hypothetical protein
MSSTSIAIQQARAFRGRAEIFDLSLGSPPDWRSALRGSRRVVAEDRDQQQAAIQVIFGTTRTEASLLMELVRQGSLCRARYPSPGAIDVHVFHLRRKLDPHDIAVISVHGHGYRLSPDHRERLQYMIERARAA